MNRAVFLDRDGTVTVLGDYVYKISDFAFIDGSEQAVKLAKEAGFLVVIVTNQAGVGRGLYTEKDVKKFHDHLQNELEKTGTSVDAFYYSPYHPTHGIGDYLKDTECRKPKPGMMLQAAKDFDIDLKKSYMIGDNIGDVQAGLNAGCRPILVRTGYGIDHESRLDELTEPPAGVYDDLLEAVKTIVNGDV